MVAFILLRAPAFARRICFCGVQYARLAATLNRFA